jgi:hypothetical protein
MLDAATAWERYRGGSPEAERVVFERLGRDIMRVQARLQKRSGALNIDRAFHAKPLLAVANATFRFNEDLPEDLSQGFARPGAEYPALVRLSNASGIHQADAKRDLRGAAVRVQVSESETHDLLMTNFPVPHARDAEQFVAFALAMSGNRIIGVVKLVFAVGPREAIRMLKNVISGSKRKVASLALETFWSRGAMLWGEAGPVRFLLRPTSDAPPAPASSNDHVDLHAELADRLSQAEVEYEFCVQRFVDEQTTPIENAAVEWAERVSPLIVVARLVIPKNDILSTDAQDIAHDIEQLDFNPWRTTDAFRPLGNLNRARKAVYEASAAHRRGLRFHTEVPLRNRITTAVLSPLFRIVNRWRPWHRLPLLISLLNLSLLRHQLREENLIDTDPSPAPPVPEPDMPTLPEVTETARVQRSFDGTENDLSAPRMGAVGATFGRNMKPRFLPDLIDTPNAITVSRELLYRENFIPATIVNVLAAAWIQFQVHDWVQHRRHPLGDKDIRVAIPDGGTWANTKDGEAESVMRIAGDMPIADAGDGLVFANNLSHWWDGSEVYGVDHKTALSLLEGPKLRLEKGYLPENMNGAEVTGFNESWWLGLSAMHTLFAREHNAVCDALQQEYGRAWSDSKIYQTARLVISALIAKIHTIEWTPAILATEAIDVALNVNWSGAPENLLTRFGLWLTEAQALKGIPESMPDHHGAPYCLTEDFVTVYRLHPLLPDDYKFYNSADGRFVEAHSFNDIQGIKTDEIMRRMKLNNVLYSLGTAHPGAITLHNYPRALQEFERENGERVDLSVVDIMRERARGIPRYNAFREGLHKEPVRRWEDLTANPESVRRLREIYKDIDQVDTMVGLLAENPPTGFGFSDTSFRIFILMASRRLQSDRFLNVDFRPEIYSPLGYQWVQENGMTSVILRHHPELSGVLPRAQSAFAPWRRVRPQSQ